MEQINLNNRYQLNKLNPNFRAADYAAQPQQNIQLPDMYYSPDSSVEKKGFKETVKQFDVMQLVSPWLEHPLLMLASCTGLAFGVDKLSQSFGGEYDKSLLGKTAHFGDKIENSKFIQSDFIQKPSQAITKGWKNTIKFLKKSDTIRAMLETPSMPEWSMPKSEMISQEHRITEEFIRIADTLGLSSEGIMSGGGTSPLNKLSGTIKKQESHLKLSNLGLTKDEKNYIKGFSNITETEASCRVLLKRLGKNDADITRIIADSDATKLVGDEILKEMGLERSFIDQLKKDPGKIENIAKVKEAVKKVSDKVWIGAGHYDWMGKFQPFARKIGCDQVNNRFLSIGEGAKTTTGKIMAKATQLLHRGFTFGGGKLGVLMFVSPLIVDTILNTKKADPDKKVGTAAHGLIGFGTWVITFPLALKIFHAFGGMKYAGMSKDDVELFRDKLNKFNTLNKEGAFTTKEAYNVAKKDLKKELKGLLNTNSKNQTLLTRISKGIGRFLTMDLEKIDSWNGGNAFRKFFAKTGNRFKNFFGVPMRFALWGVISMVVLEGAISKVLDKVFGKEYDASKEEERKENQKAQKEFLKTDLENRMLELQKQKIEAAQTQNTVQETNAVKENTIPPITPVIPQNKNNTENNTGEMSNTSEKAIAQNSPERQELINNKEQQPIQNINKKTSSTENKKEEQPSTQDNIEQNENKYIPNQNSTITPKEQEQKNRDNYTYIPSQDSNIKNPEKEYEQNKYIPSQQANNFTKTFDNSHLSDALKRADKAEQLALRTLAGKFDNM